MIALYITLGIIAWLGIGVLVAALVDHFVWRYTSALGLDPDEPIDWLVAGAMVVTWPMMLLYLALAIIGRGLVLLVGRLSGV